MLNNRLSDLGVVAETAPVVISRQRECNEGYRFDVTVKAFPNYTNYYH